MTTYKKKLLEIKNVNKIYKFGSINYSTLIDEIQEFFSNIFKKKKSYMTRSADNNLYFSEKIVNKSFFALKDINLNVYEGQAIAILGKNGSGKTTLLKCISRICFPSSGHIEINGSIAPILNIGSTINPELTGLENIFFIGAMYGMKKKEIQIKQNQIIKFAEIEKFIDTPVKRYSTGMNARLALSIVIHLDVDIFLADEVLTVGDKNFKMKCIKRFKELLENDKKSIILVSHEIELVKMICTHAIVITKGNSSKLMQIDEAYDYYNNLSN
jgi:lipopolysaccharide transport system ATP-binding protein